ncbi:hypothetical protein DFH09DRAFT_1503227 [Mycena vulgaris]|nr:hypothetical protein DFH09DRAFT_1503227 [Mycena vulgaris]
MGATTIRDTRNADYIRKLLPDIVERAGDDSLHGRYLVTQLNHNYADEVVDAESLIARAVQHFRNAGDGAGEALLYNALAAYYHGRSDMAQAWSYCECAVEASVAINDEGQQCIAVHWKAEIHFRRAEYRAGIVQGLEGRRLAKRTGSFPLKAYCMRAQAMSCAVLGDFKGGAALCAAGRELRRACALDGGNADLQIMNMQAETFFQQTAYGASLAIHIEPARLTPATVRPLDHAYALVNIATIVGVITGVPDGTVLHNLIITRDIFTARAFTRGLCNCDVVVADVLGDCDGSILCLDKLGDIRWDLQDSLGTFGYRVVYLASACKTRNAAAAAHALRGVGDVVKVLGNAETARDVFRAALDGFTTMGMQGGMDECSLRFK